MARVEGNRFGRDRIELTSEFLVLRPLQICCYIPSFFFFFFRFSVVLMGRDLLSRSARAVYRPNESVKALWLITPALVYV